MSDRDPGSEETIFSTALRRPPAERKTYLNDACAGRPALRQRIEALLRATSDLGGFMERTSVASLDSLRNRDSRVSRDATEEGTITRIGRSMMAHCFGKSPPAPEEMIGTRIGRYKLLQKLGEGGCGVVFMAEQEEPVKRRVALKLIKLGMDTHSVIARFEVERQVLAMMDHPNIAKVLDADSTEGGRPYFVMELVRGVKITEFCDQNRLSTRERLDLFIQVCQAVQHAHQKGIIHRDLKPSNILVTINDPGSPGVPKIIDFGIAKATQGRLTDQTLFTAFEQFLGTPAYMSPEQTLLTALDVDTRSDIYSLGVLLYELLTGSPPFNPKELMAAGLDEMRRTIREKEPPRPSTHLSALLANEQVSAAAYRQTDPPRLIHLVRGDLDWIVMRCLEKDRARRYETANALATDIQRHLSNEPVAARPPSRLYEFQKSVRRHRVGFGATVLVMAALSLGLAGVLWQWRNSEAHRRRAEAGELSARWNAYAADMNNVQTALARHDLGRGRELLDQYQPENKSEVRNGQPGSNPKFEMDLRGWEWRYFWKLARGDEKFRLCQYSDLIGALEFSPGGRQLILRGEREGVVAWDFVTRKPVAQTAAGGSARSLAISPVGTLAAFTDIGKDGSQFARLWDYAAGRDVAVLGLPANAPWLDFSPDGAALAILTADGFVHVWEIGSQRFLARLLINDVFLPGSAAKVHFGPTGRWLAIAQSGRVLLWDWRSDQQRQLPLVSASANAPALAWSSDGRYLAAGCSQPDAPIFVWDLFHCTDLTSIPELPAFQVPGDRHLVQALAFSPDGKTLASGGVDQTIRLWDVENRRERRRLRGHLHELRSVAFSPDGRQLVSCGLDGAVRVWDPGEPPRADPYQALPMPVPLNGCAFAPDGASFIALDLRDGSASLWDTATMKEREELAYLGTNHAAVAWAADGRTVALSERGRNLRIWDFETRRTITNFVRDSTYTVRLRFEGRNTLLEVIALRKPRDPSPTWPQTRVARLWDTTDWREIAVPAEALEGLKDAAVSPDRRTLIVASGKGSVAWWDLPSGRRLARFENQFARNDAFVSFSPDGRIAALAETKGAITLWDAVSRQPSAKIHGNLRTVRALAFTPDGRRLLTSGADDEDLVRLLDLNSRRYIASLPTPEGSYGFITMSPDETSLVAIGFGGTAVFWRAPSWARIEAEEKAMGK